MAFNDEIATGGDDFKITIGGRIRPGVLAEKYILAEEPGEPVRMHWRDRLVPHFRRDCPHCDGTGEDTKAMVYVGGWTLTFDEVIIELNWKCFCSARSAAVKIERDKLGDLFDVAVQKPRFTGLKIEISRSNFQFSPRVLRCESRVPVNRKWRFDTRRELARIWGIPVRPRLYQEETA